MECCKSVGVEGGKLQLDSFGIELVIPPGAIDSETPQDIALHVLTDTPDLGNSEEEMSVCFGVQCLAPDGMVLKSPVTFTIPHCAILSRLYNVKAILYCGEGEYTPGAVVKECIQLPSSGIPSCVIMEDVLKFRVNHFTWWFFTFSKNDSLQGKRLCCLPMICTKMPVERTPVILHAHLYDDLMGNKEYAIQRWIKGLFSSKESWLEEELKLGYEKVHSETQIFIEPSEVDLTLMCAVNKGTPEKKMLSYMKMFRLGHNCMPFELDLRNQPDTVAVSLKVGQDDETELLFPIAFTSCMERESSVKGTEVSESKLTRQNDFDEMLKTVAKRVVKQLEIDDLGKALGFTPEEISRYIDTNHKGREVTCDGTLLMLRDWRKKQTRETEGGALKAALEESDQIHLAMSVEGNVTPVEMECRKSVGVEGGKLQLKSFGIELEIPPGAIDRETPQDISLRVLTDTANLGNSKDEMSVCFGVQCVAPDDLDLKLPVTYTIPHCAEITRFSSVEAVLYTGEGKYTPDAVIKERILLSSSGLPSYTIMKDELKLKMNHFSWVAIRLRIKNFFSQKKRMCCRPFRDRNLPVKTEPVILRAYLYRDIPGNRELIKNQEAEQEFIPAHPEMEVSVIMAEVDLTMTCLIKETVIGSPAVVSFEKLKSGQRICQSFSLDFTNQPDIVVVSVRVGQNPRLEVNLMFALKFTGPQGSPLNQEQLKVSSSSRTPPTSHRTEEDTLDSVKETKIGEENDFDEMLKTIAKRVVKRMEIDDLGKALGFTPEEISRYIETNHRGQEVTCDGTLLMLRDWRKKQTKDTEGGALKAALKKAGQIHLANELFGT